jgi:hypothetical protein
MSVADHMRKQLASFDHLVGAGEDRGRYGEVERLGGFQIDEEFELGRQLRRQVGRHRPFEDSIGVARRG